MLRASFYLSVLFFSCIINLNFAQDRSFCPWEDGCYFQKGDILYMFGDNVKFRSQPKIDSEVLDLLKMGDAVEIIETTDSTERYNGLESPFYKVNYKGVNGYILGGLFSLSRQTIHGTNYFFNFSKENEALFLNIRSIYLGSIREEKIPLSNSDISIEAYGSRGLHNLDGILYVNYHPNYDGDQSGGIYLFVFEGTLSKYELSQFQDEDASYYMEKFIFPDEEGGFPEKIIFKKEQAYTYITGTQWLREYVETWLLSWDLGSLTPNFREKFPYH
ncbi:SH3 domain-containing protein [Flagellimonas chongwuensis]|nr:SH3 domain-containing protein [Allomuricauda chongwuensis]